MISDRDAGIAAQPYQMGKFDFPFICIDQGNLTTEEVALAYHKRSHAHIEKGAFNRAARNYEKVEVDDVWAYPRQPALDRRLGEGIVG